MRWWNVPENRTANQQSEGNLPTRQTGRKVHWNSWCLCEARRNHQSRGDTERNHEAGAGYKKMKTAWQPTKATDCFHDTRGFPHGKSILPRRRPPDKKFLEVYDGKSNHAVGADPADAGAGQRGAAADPVHSGAVLIVKKTPGRNYRPGVSF